MWLLPAVALLSFQAFQVSGHGRMMNPPARNSMWRFGYPNPVDYNDNELYCGGFAVQWDKNDGKCGVCGDAWNDPVPRLHEAGGFFANGYFGKRYTPGQIIDIEIELTANHKGYFELRLCPLTGDPTKAERQDCFNKYPLYLEGQSTYRFQIPQNSAKQETFNYRVKLPDGVTCTHCVIQWIYFTGNTWDTCEDGTASVGCGKQETFRNCADVSIITNTGGFGPAGLVPAAPTSLDENMYALKVIDFNKETNQFEAKNLVVRSQVCVAKGRFKLQPNFDNWCMANCLKYPPTCPDDACQCLTDCVPTEEFAQEEGVDLEDLHVFCHINCLRFPPNEKCQSRCKCS